MLWLRVRGWLVRPSRVYFIICRDVHPVRRGQVLKCGRRELIGNLRQLPCGEVYRYSRRGRMRLLRRGQVLGDD